MMRELKGALSPDLNEIFRNAAAQIPMMRELKAEKDGGTGLDGNAAAQIPMMRELKGSSRCGRWRIKDAAAAQIPMMRELKARGPARSIRRDSRCSPNPYDEGTERPPRPGGRLHDHALQPKSL